MFRATTKTTIHYAAGWPTSSSSSSPSPLSSSFALAKKVHALNLTTKLFFSTQVGIVGKYSVYTASSGQLWRATLKSPLLNVVHSFFGRPNKRVNAAVMLTSGVESSPAIILLMCMATCFRVKATGTAEEHCSVHAASRKTIFKLQKLAALVKMLNACPAKNSTRDLHDWQGASHATFLWMRYRWSHVVGT